MSIRRHALWRVRTLGLLAAVLAVGALTQTGQVRAAQKADGKFKLFFSDRPNDLAPRSFVPLRPNVQQQFFVYVQNLTDKDEAVTVQLEAGGIAVEGSAVTVTA